MPTLPKTPTVPVASTGGTSDILKAIQEAAAGGGTKTITDADIAALITSSTFGFGSNADITDTASFLGPQSYGAGSAVSFREGRAAGTPVTITQARTDMINMDPTSLTKLQDNLYRAGLYPDSYYSHGIKPSYGDPDVDTQIAYGQLLKQAVLEKPAGHTISDILARKQANFADTLAKSGTGQFHVISVSDPAELHDLADQVAQSVLGRKATAKERAKVVSVIQSRQQQRQRSAASAEAGGASSVDVTQVSPQSDIKEMLTNENPAEAAANQFSNTTQDFFSILKGPAGG